MCDFGYSINQNHSLPVTAVGTPGYTGIVCWFAGYLLYMKHCTIQELRMLHRVNTDSEQAVLYDGFSAFSHLYCVPQQLFDSQLCSRQLTRQACAASLKGCFAVSATSSKCYAQSLTPWHGHDSTLFDMCLAAPEILRTVRRRYDGKPADVWSTGVVLYAMLFCQYPFDRRNGDPPQHSQDFQRLFIDRLKAADIM